MDLILFIALVLIIVILWPLIKAYALLLLIVAVVYVLLRNGNRRL